ncbi:MAG: aminomethyl-transferring glycine dehydrogenase [Flavobacteriaceae bacterium]|jgi:glycine dehydrogenase|nr:aminomethyl-transferring glycine dehydrogenase [Flavobacteriaceae bacterium]MBT4113521.1 aminomethyl-transferring glycine dehydrogenase [Flavobacteriaceae bacterium]MBT4613705.1 aminomethyl-transferring glycine dehydrogenase [Flavobacteriaceae bacterium]MBT5246039.1 aminomethyl-transferring glycine dehydrogenase [Flavobacteriaceae bacterium]MBT5650694.1 aminomethyl-transferring glycine dehydrogenase [Flavobacteriaceae bacterium]
MNTESFLIRHIGPRDEDIKKMLKTIKAKSLDQLIDETLPNDIKLKKPIELDNPLSESEYLMHLKKISGLNKVYKSYIGLGYNRSYLPAVIQRNILENPGWYTAYTPYQAEISQGRMEALLNFQTMITDLTGMEISNASLLDESTAAAEAMNLLYAVRDREQKKSNVSKFFVSKDVFPQTLSVLKTRSKPIGIELVIDDVENFDFDSTFFGALIQYPGASGEIKNISSFISKCISSNIKTAVAADILSLVLLESPGKIGADVVVGTTQRFGIPLGYGGPHAGYFATKEAYKRNIPGRIIGISIDCDGDKAFRMALQTREQHIKRDKATSNICTSQVLLAVMAGMYAVYHGPKGLKEIANKVHFTAVTLSKKLKSLGLNQLNSSFFDTIRIEANRNDIEKEAERYEINFYYPSKNIVSITINETITKDDLNDIVSVFSKITKKTITTLDKIEEESTIGKSFIRKTNFLTNSVFSSYHSETELMRYMKSLENKDLSLNRSMISLGSCTMKLNASAEMLPLSWNSWGNIHPFAPKSQTKGFEFVLKKLENQLKEITGFSATSLQPNSGAQGEYAGLMVIKAFHESKRNSNRNICLIPSSAHGTNPASAVMAGMKVVVVKSNEKGNIDIDDLKSKAIENKENLAALMVTYPSTHGVFESNIIEITNTIHHNGGQVYMDGANMNAQVGITTPKIIGADVCHLNLHKTFAIPHGGGGPGVGPICVAKHLAPFLPSNPIINVGGTNAISAISSAPYGSALACLISYGYISMLGAEGLTKATKIAILNANYIKERLSKKYKILYSGKLGRAAHEMIIDCRPFKENGIEVSDIAKRLIDYGFHAPTVSFPVAGTLMIEPTESESKNELDRFCNAMLSIREEISNCSENDKNNILKNAPHTLSMVTSDNWKYDYSREQAAFPIEYLKENKFWASVRRVDDAYGDRNLICNCVSIEEYSS